MSASSQPDPKSRAPQVNPAQLASVLSHHFNLEELEALSFELNFEFEELGEGGRTTKSVRLVKYFERTGRLNELAEAVLEKRPSITRDDLRLDTVATGAGQMPGKATYEPMPAFDEAINDHIRSLDYDPRSLLSVQKDGRSETPPVTERRESGNAVIVCTRKECSLKRNLSDVLILRPTGGVIFPGALLYADRNLMEGRPVPIGLERGPLTLTVDLPGLPDRPEPISDPTSASVRRYLTGLLREWNESPDWQEANNPARSSLQTTGAYSAQQTALDLGFTAEWVGGEVAAKLDLNSGREGSVAVALLRQLFYSLTVEAPHSPAAVFAAGVGLDQIRDTMRDDAVPAYVRSVDYGRILIIVMETPLLDTRANVDAALRQAIAGDAGAGASADDRYAHIINKATFSVYAMGDGVSSTAEFSGDADGVESLRQQISEDATYRADNPGAPISYTMAFLKDNTPAEMGFTANYVQTECISYPNGFVRLRHDGAYVARWTVSWEEIDQSGEYVAQSWSSGKKSAGYVHQLDLPGDARKVKIYADAMTGLAWDVWEDAINVTEDGPTNKTYRIYGSTLERKHEIFDSPD